MKDYVPINCELVDYIEHFSTLRREVMILFGENEKEHKVQAVIKDWVNENGIEYMILSDGIKIRFDNILRIENIDFRSKTSCRIR